MAEKAMINGTSALRVITIEAAEKPQEDFQRLLSDCRRGKIDRVLTKSVSRFARNTKECLEAIRELKQLGIGIYFEEQNISISGKSPNDTINLTGIPG